MPFYATGGNVPRLIDGIPYDISTFYPWIRPDDWLDVSDVSDNAINILASDNGHAAMAFTIDVSGTNIYTVDWGDGSIVEYNTTAEHIWEKGTGVSSSEGYTMFKVVISASENILSYQTISHPIQLWPNSNPNHKDTTTLEIVFGTKYLTSLAQACYYGNQELRSITFPDTLDDLTTLASAFSNCWKLSEVNNMPAILPKVTTLQSCFGGTNLATLTLPEMPLLTNASYVVSEVIQEINFPESLPSYNSSFILANCFRLKTLNLPKMPNTTSMQFSGNYSLTSVEFNDASLAITQMDFGNCYSLEKIILPDLPNITSLANDFDYCYSLKSVTFGELPKATSFSNTFLDCYSLYKVTFPETLPLVSTFSSTFNDCWSLKFVNFPASLPSATTMTDMFRYCRSIKSISFGELPLVNNFQGIFTGCNSLENLVLPDSLPELTTMRTSFQNCYSLPEFVFPEVPKLNNMQNMFQEARSLKSVTLPSSLSLVTSLYAAFYRCGSLTHLDFPNLSSLTSLYQTFLECYSLRSVTFADGSSGNITSCYYAFDECYSLATIDIPFEKLTGTCERMFNNTTSLSSATFNLDASGITNLDAAFYDSGIYSVRLPTYLDKLTTLEDAFRNCGYLEHIELPESLPLVTSMQTCFSTSRNLTSIVFPKNLPLLTRMDSAFYGAFRLKEIDISSNMPLLNNMNSTFNSCRDLYKIIFPYDASGVISMQQTIASCYDLQILENTHLLGSRTTPVNATDLMYSTNSLTDISLNTAFSYIELQGRGSTFPNRLENIRLPNQNSTFTGSSPQINVSYNSLDASALDILFGDLPTLVGKTISITGNVGAADCSTKIATDKGWTVTGYTG